MAQEMPNLNRRSLAATPQTLLKFNCVSGIQTAEEAQPTED